MATITQDMRFCLSLIHYATHHGVTKTAIKYQIANTSIGGKTVTMVPGILCVTVPDDHITTHGNIPRKKSNSFLTCAAAISMPAWLFSG